MCEARSWMDRRGRGTDCRHGRLAVSVPITQLDVTWARACRVFWSIFWRTALFVVAPAFILGIVAYDLSPALVASYGATLPLWLSPEMVAWLALALLGVLLAFVAGAFVMKAVLTKSYSDFRIVLEGPSKPLRIEPRVAAKKVPRRIEPTLTIDPSAAFAPTTERAAPRQRPR